MANQYTTTSYKNLVIELRNKRYTMVRIGEIFGVSKQRIHQILNDYSTWNNKKNELEKYCETCGEPAEERHHIDKNPKNNHPNNIMSLCKKCHGIIHRGTKYKTLGITKVDLTCRYCGKNFQKDISTYNQAKKRKYQNFFCSKSHSAKYRYHGKI